MGSVRLSVFASALCLLGCAAEPRREAPPRELQQDTTLEGRVDHALEWLLAHQAGDGHWDCDQFALECAARGGEPCSGSGEAANDVAATALAVLAILECEAKEKDGRFKTAVERGVRWLVSQQQSGGRIGRDEGAFALHNHALATYALAETYLRARPFLLRFPAQKAVDFALSARNPGRAWPHAARSKGENDTSVSGWMVLALDTALRSGLRVDRSAFDGARAWFAEVTDPETGRCGSTERGSNSSSVARIDDRDAFQSGEALTAISVDARARWNELDADAPLAERQLALLCSKPPLWNEVEPRNDLYAWLFTTRALRQAGSDDAWGTWRRALEAAFVAAQSTTGDAAGSAPPLDPWGSAGGRIYSTALFALCAEELGERPPSSDTERQEPGPVRGSPTHP